MYEAIARFYGARDGRKSTMYTYLCQPDGSIFSFSARCVNAVPKMTGGYEDLEYGAIFKLFDYDIPYKSLIGYDLRYRLNALIPCLFFWTATGWIPHTGKTYSWPAGTG